MNNVTTQYYLIVDKVGALSKGSDKLFFHYNERDMLVGFEYDKENYFYGNFLPNSKYQLADLPVIESYADSGKQEIWFAVKK